MDHVEKRPELLERGEVARALAAARRSVAALRDANAPERLVTALAAAAEAEAVAGHVDTALQLATEGVAIAQACGDTQSVALACRVLGDLHGQLGQLNEGEHLLTQALQASTSTAAREGQAQALEALCRNAVRQAERASCGATTTRAEWLERAVVYGQRGLEAARRSDNPRAEAASAASLALALLRQESVGDALALLGVARELAAANGCKLLQARLAVVEGEALLARGAARDAVRHLRRLAPGCVETPLLELDLRQALWRAAKILGEFELALAAHERYHELDKRIRSAVAQARAYVLINEIETQRVRLEADKARVEAELLRLKSRRLESEKRALEAHARELDRHVRQDPLTGLWNRRYIDDELPRLLADAQARGAPLAIALGDVDHFKTINDQYGHPIGDRVLCAVADLLRDNCRPADTVARVGGEEFLLVLEDTDLKGGRHVCERLRRAIEKHAWNAIAPGLTATISFGLADAAKSTQAHEALVVADGQLYAAKRGGRNRVEAQSG